MFSVPTTFPTRLQKEPHPRRPECGFSLIFVFSVFAVPGTFSILDGHKSTCVIEYPYVGSPLVAALFTVNSEFDVII